MTKEVRKVIQCAYDLIKDRKHWTRNDFARTASGHSISPNSPKAARWCAIGAMQHCAPKYSLLESAVRIVSQATPGNSIGQVNDRPASEGGGHKAVCKIFEAVLKEDS